MICIWCGEEVLPEELLVGFYCIRGSGQLHRECMIRTIIGSLAHLQGKCSCRVKGSCEGDPEGVSKREGARLAYHFYRMSMSPTRN